MKGNEQDFSALKENRAYNEVGDFLKYHLEYLIFFSCLSINKGKDHLFLLFYDLTVTCGFKRSQLPYLPGNSCWKTQFSNRSSALKCPP